MANSTSQPSSSSSPHAIHPKRIPPIRWTGFVLGVLALFLMVLTARLALRLARWQEPARYTSIAMLLLAAALTTFGFRTLWQSVRTLTLRRAATIVGVSYLVAVCIAGLTTPSQVGLPRSWLNAATEVPVAAVRRIMVGSRAVVRFPGQFRAAYTGRAPLLNLSQGPELRGEPALANARATAREIAMPLLDQSQPVRIAPGAQLLVTTRGGRACHMHALAHGPFAAGATVVVVEGPRFDDGETWWRVKGASATGWCPSTSLEDMQ